MSYRIAVSLFAGFFLSGNFIAAVQADEPFKLNVKEDVIRTAPPSGAGAYYPPPTMIPAAPVSDALPPPRQPLNGNVNRAPSAPLNAGIAAPGVLPAQFLGVWQVLGNRQNIEALPQYQQGVQNIFNMTTANTWTIQGSPQQGYSLTTDSGVTTQVNVDKVEGTTAFLRYQHPVNNTVAQEAIVMQLAPGGASFEGLERISIVKQGEPGPRCKVTYKLQGRRQR